MINQKNRIYIAHAFRGPDGDAADIETIKTNTADAIRLAWALREWLPSFIFYCPHEWDYLLQPWRAGHITSGQILDHCLAIVRMCTHVYVLSNPEESAGVQLEMEEAMKAGVIIVELWPHIDNLRQIAEMRASVMEEISLRHLGVINGMEATTNEQEAANRRPGIH